MSRSRTVGVMTVGVAVSRTASVSKSHYPLLSHFGVIMKRDPVEQYTAETLRYLNKHILAISDKFVQVDMIGFGLLLEYSCSLPTGQCDGKVWKRQKNYYDPSAGWLMGEFVDTGDEKYMGIRWRNLIVVETRNALVRPRPQS